MEKIRVLIADDIREISEYYADIISSCDDMEIVGVASCGNEAIEIAELKKPDIVLMDIQMETKMAGIDATEEIVLKNSDVKVIMLTAYEDRELILKSYLAGAVDYIIKMTEEIVVKERIRKIYKEENFIGPRMIQSAKQALKKAETLERSILYIINNVSVLSSREREILIMLCKKRPRKDIMAELFIEETTLKTHIKNILKKMSYSDVKNMVNELNRMGISDLLLRADNKSKTV